MIGLICNNASELDETTNISEVRFVTNLMAFLPPANEVWGKVIFSEACVKNSVHRGEGVVSQHALQAVSQHALQVVSQHVLHGGVSRPTPKGVSRPTPRGLCIPACTEAEPPPVDGYCRGRYASYWDAFLLIMQEKCPYLRNVLLPFCEKKVFHISLHI